MSKSARESPIFGLRPRQKVKQKQQYQRPKECEAKVCQGTRGPDGAREKRDESVPKKLGQWFPRYRWNDVSYSAQGGAKAEVEVQRMITEKVAALAEAQVATMATLEGSKKHRVAKKALGVYAGRVRRNRRRLSK